MNVGALEQRASWLLGEAEKNLERRESRAADSSGARAVRSGDGFHPNARNALQLRNFNYAEQLAVKAASLARALVKA